MATLAQRLTQDQIQPYFDTLGAVEGWMQWNEEQEAMVDCAQPEYVARTYLGRNPIEEGKAAEQLFVVHVQAHGEINVDVAFLIESGLSKIVGWYDLDENYVATLVDGW